MQSRENLVFEQNMPLGNQPQTFKEEEKAEPKIKEAISAQKPPEVQQKVDSTVSDDRSRDTQKHTMQFQSLVEKSKEHLAKVSTAKIPIDLFPDEIIVDISHITIIFRQLFGAKQVRSIPLRGVVNVEVDSIPLRATLRLHDMKDKQNPVEISGLKKKDAEKVRRVIEGLIVADKKQIDLTKVDDQDLASKIETLGGA